MATQVAKLTISLPKSLISFADKIASEEKISRSKVIALCLQEVAEQRRITELEEGYKAMAKENREYAKTAFELQRRVIPEWK